ncbi:hypothetical protein WR25_24002 [Diploscapter pachys]|uniref:Mediator of RNA polymerase II transcription subunit 31 n=1 Tax=Diploscapter pachys TaxID=2018661 RepID=A0A2A2KRA4_9BILA|nr:hypothetical protein WR25_24002 [Diploscapter pachys]
MRLTAVRKLTSLSLSIHLALPSTLYLDSPEETKRRFEIECEFVQALCNPHYLNFLAQRGYFKEAYFINYLKYLLYWKKPEYAKCLKYPQCLFFLDLVQEPEFREAIASTAAAKFIEDQQILQWQYYLRQRQRLHENPDAAERQTVDTATTQEIGDEAIDYSDNEDSDGPSTHTNGTSKQNGVH